MAWLSRALLTPPDSRIVVSGSAKASMSFSSCPPMRVRPSSIFAILVCLHVLRSLAWRFPSLSACLSNSFFLLGHLSCSSFGASLALLCRIIFFALEFLSCSRTGAGLSTMRRLLLLEGGVEPASSEFLLWLSLCGVPRGVVPCVVLL